MESNNNFLLYQMYLEDLGREDLFEATKHIKLKDIKTFVALRPIMTSERNIDLINDIRYVRGQEPIEKTTQATKIDVNVLASIRELLDIEESMDVTALSKVVDQIEEYHEARRRN